MSGPRLEEATKYDPSLVNQGDGLPPAARFSLLFFSKKIIKFI